MGIKRLIFLIILILLLGYFGRGGGDSKDNSVVLEPSPSAEVVVEPVTVLADGVNYGIYYQEIRGEISLIPNFSEKLSSEKIFSENNCKYGANGGFYTKDGQPLGLFAAGGKIIGKEIESPTFNGFFWKEKGNLKFDWSRPGKLDDIEFVIQSGPLFDVEFLGKGSFVDDEEKRRVLVAKDKAGKFYFVTIFEKGKSFGGPKLSDISKILRESEMADFDKALNLDGGSASAFYREDGIKIWELVSIGSFFCGK